MSSLSIHPFLFFFWRGGGGGSTQQPPTFLVCSCTWETEGCEGPSDRCPPGLQVVTFLSNRYGAGGGCFRPQPNLSMCTKVCILEDVLLVFWVFLSSSRRTLILTSRSRLEIRSPEVATEVNLKVYVLRKVDGWYFQRETQFKSFPSLSFSITPSVLDIGDSLSIMSETWRSVLDNRWDVSKDLNQTRVGMKSSSRNWDPFSVLFILRSLWGPRSRFDRRLHGANLLQRRVFSKRSQRLIFHRNISRKCSNRSLTKASRVKLHC